MLSPGWTFLQPLVSAFLLVAIPPEASPFAVKGQDVKLEAVATEVFDDNVTFAERDVASDFISRFLVSAELIREHKLGSLEFSGSLTQDLYARHHEFSNLSETLSTEWRAEPSRHDRLTVSNVFRHAEEPRSFDEAFHRGGGRYSFFKNVLTLGYARDVTKQLTLNGRYAHELHDVSRDDLRDAQLHTAGLEGQYAVSSATILIGAYDFAHRNLDPGRGSSVHTLAGGARRYLTSQLYVDGRAGFNLTHGYDNEQTVKPLFSASLTGDLDGRSKARFTFDRWYATSPSVEDLYGSWQMAASYDRQLGRRLAGSLAAFFGDADYLATELRDRLWGLRTDFTYEFSPQLKGRAGYTFTDATSTDSTREYLKNTVAVSLTMEF